MNIVKTLVGAAVLVLSAPAAEAALGGDATSVQAEATRLNAQLAQRPVAASQYTVQRLTLASGTVVDEYLSSTGTVFALSWRGARAPDLAQLLGSYYEEYQAASTSPHVRATHVQYDTARLAYRAGGHPRALWGSAIVPELLPAGVTAEDLK